MCVEGSHDAIERSIIPDSDTRLVEHDFSRGPWWPEKTYDAAWSVEFLEHVGLNYQFNYVSVFRKAALIFVTASQNEGWHHVEVHPETWWIQKYESYGFKFNKELSEVARSIAYEGRRDYPTPREGEYFNGFYSFQMMVFVNPMVASLPRHAHIFPHDGCLTKGPGNRPCSEEKGESVLPESMHPLKLTQEMDEAWLSLVKNNVKMFSGSAN